MSHNVHAAKGERVVNHPARHPERSEGPNTATVAVQIILRLINVENYALDKLRDSSTSLGMTNRPTVRAIVRPLQSA